MVARWAHNPKVTGSSPVPATKKIHNPLQISILEGVLFFGGRFGWVFAQIIYPHFRQIMKPNFAPSKLYLQTMAYY